MKAAIKEQWIKDLRSGKFAQCEGSLRDSYGARCCLGVLMVSAGRTKDHEDPLEEDRDGEELSQEFQKMVGINSKTCDVLISRNDGLKGFVTKPQSFTQIADYIERSIPAD